MPCWPQDSRLLTSRIVRECFFCFKPPYCGHLLQQPIYDFYDFPSSISTDQNSVYPQRTCSSSIFLVKIFWFFLPLARRINLASLFLLQHFIQMFVKTLLVSHNFIFLSCLSTSPITGIESTLYKYVLHNYGTVAHQCWMRAIL